MGVVTILPFIGVSLLGAFIIQVLGFFYATRIKRIDVVDAIWGINFIAVIIALQLYTPSTDMWTLTVDALVTIWGLRLSWYIYSRFHRSSKQDERYADLMNKWPQSSRGAQIFLKIFVVQALLSVMISLPVITVHVHGPNTNILSVLGLTVWFVGFGLEYTADHQLKAFLQHPNGQLMKKGVWRYSRHPNYFGEISMWWGIALIASTTPVWAIGLIGAATVTFLLCFISGIPLAERRARSKEGWDIYKQKTSILIPWPPKK